MTTQLKYSLPILWLKFTQKESDVNEQVQFHYIKPGYDVYKNYNPKTQVIVCSTALSLVV